MLPYRGSYTYHIYVVYQVLIKKCQVFSRTLSVTVARVCSSAAHLQALKKLDPKGPYTSLSIQHAIQTHFDVHMLLAKHAKTLFGIDISPESMPVASSKDNFCSAHLDMWKRIACYHYTRRAADKKNPAGLANYKSVPASNKIMKHNSAFCQDIQEYMTYVLHTMSHTSQPASQPASQLHCACAATYTIANMHRVMPAYAWPFISRYMREAN